MQSVNRKKDVEKLLKYIRSKSDLTLILKLLEQMDVLPEILNVLQQGNIRLTLPTNKALEKVDFSKLNQLTKDEKEKITQILKYHVHKNDSNNLLSCTLFDNKPVAQSDTKVNDANVLSSKTFGNNIVSIIDKLIVPKNCDPNCIPAGEECTDCFAGISRDQCCSGQCEQTVPSPLFPFTGICL
jgi:uncharacterized surface protein with fasciclin (FAS1) repeats